MSQVVSIFSARKRNGHGCPSPAQRVVRINDAITGVESMGSPNEALEGSDLRLLSVLTASRLANVMGAEAAAEWLHDIAEVTRGLGRPPEAA